MSAQPEGEFARLAISGAGPYWHEFKVEVDGKSLPVLRVTIEIDPQTNKCQATVVLDEFYIDATDVPAHVLAEARP